MNEYHFPKTAGQVWRLELAHGHNSGHPGGLVDERLLGAKFT